MVRNDALCQLCSRKATLQLSHIVPAFAVRYLKKTSITGYLRSSGQPNITQQDSEKYPLFCSECENLLSAEEKYFAEKIFLPYHEGNLREFEYDHRLGRFCAIQAFRKIVYDEAINPESFECSPYIAKKLTAARNYLGQFILAGAKTQNEYNSHVIFVNLIGNVGEELPSLPGNFNMYLTRSIDTAIASSRTSRLYIYNKICKIIVLTFIRPKKPKQYEGTRIFGIGSINPWQVISLPADFLYFLIDRASKVGAAYDVLSEKQKELIIKRFKENEGKIIDSESTRAFFADEKLRARNDSEGEL